MTKPTENTIQRIHDWAEKNHLTPEDFENAGFNEIVEIISDQDDDIELSNLIAIQEYSLEHGYNDEKINERIIQFKNQK